MLPLERTEIIVRPKIPSQKYSGGPNFKENSANGSADVASTKFAMTLPTKEAKAAVTRACWAIPFWARGKPSNVVAIAAGVPGVFIKIAGMASAYIAPTYIPASIIKPAAGSIPKVNGTRRARPMVAVKPGMDPK